MPGMMPRCAVHVRLAVMLRALAALLGFRIAAARGAAALGIPVVVIAVHVDGPPQTSAVSATCGGCRLDVARGTWHGMIDVDARPV